MRYLLLGGALIFSACASHLGHADEPNGWELVWSDEFEGSQIDNSKWSHEVDCWGGGNEERQCYTAEPDNSFVDGGYLFINAFVDPTTGPALPPRIEKDLPEDEKGATARKPFSSARLNTRGKGEWTYGKFEVRARMPEGQGMWPAIWMLPAEDHYGGWAASGEIDIVEAVNWGTKCNECDGDIENRIFGTIHYGAEWPKNKYKGEETPVTGKPGAFHVYSVEWKKGEIAWFVDGQKFSTLRSEDWQTKSLFGKNDNPAAPFDRPFFLVMNLAIGGHLAEDRNEGGVTLEGYPKSMVVDWVRVYQRQDVSK